MPARRFNPCNSCCDPVPGAYFWFITSTSNYESQFTFTDCDITCNSPYDADPEDETEHPITGNVFGGGMNFPFRQYAPYTASTVVCVGVTGWGWKMELTDDGPPPAQGPIFTWRMSPYKTPLDEGVISILPEHLNPYNIGPYVGTGTIEELRLNPVSDENGMPVLDSYGRQTYEGGIWLENQNTGTSCAHGVPDRMLLIDWRQSSCCYLPAAGIPPLTA